MAAHRFIERAYGADGGSGPIRFAERVNPIGLIARTPKAALAFGGARPPRMEFIDLRIR